MEKQSKLFGDPKKYEGEFYEIGRPTIKIIENFFTVPEGMIREEIVIKRSLVKLVK